MKKILLLVVLFLLTSPTALATSQEIYDGLGAAGLEQELPEEASNFLKEGLAGSADVEEALGRW